MLLKRAKPEAVQIATELAAWLRARGDEALIIGNHNVPPHGARFIDESELVEAIDLLVVLGGDGTLLHGAAIVADQKVPILGVNLGHLGFLTSCAPADARSAIDRALGGELPLEQRLRLRVDVVRGSGGGEHVTRYACNDAVVSQGALARLIELEAFLDDRLITRYRADGLIVATPTGSTAYNLAAGGPIVTSEVRAFVMTPICPHTLTHRPVVVQATSRVTVRLASPADHVQLTVDGQWGTNLSDGDRVEISQAVEPLRLFRSPQSYFDVLREKMNWGEK
ncbi:MAG: ATP-NAD/AcoX kinase [Myxococcales bacterium]|nr:ATP-NAD/AcoX kinase [Myxococcales bacterium]